MKDNLFLKLIIFFVVLFLFDCFQITSFKYRSLNISSSVYAVIGSNKIVKPKSNKLHSIDELFPDTSKGLKHIPYNGEVIPFDNQPDKDKKYKFISLEDQTFRYLIAFIVIIITVFFLLKSFWENISYGDHKKIVFTISIIYILMFLFPPFYQFPGYSFENYSIFRIHEYNFILTPSSDYLFINIFILILQFLVILFIGLLSFLHRKINMNKNQNIILFLVSLFIIVMFLFPCFYHYDVYDKSYNNLGYSLIYIVPDSNSAININMLLFQWLFVLIIGGLFIYYKSDNV